MVVDTPPRESDEFELEAFAQANVVKPIPSLQSSLRSSMERLVRMTGFYKT